MLNKRPSKKEIFKKIQEAKRLVQTNKINVLNQDRGLFSDAQELGYDIQSELKDLLIELLKNSCPSKYAGTYPPQKSYASKIKDMELWAFTVKTDFFDKEVKIYFKFSLKNGFFYLVSLHEDRGRKR